jgi:conjugative relaxase-like TrwC/TraI family protein
MISMHKISSAGGAANYHDKAFSQDGLSQADNYYVGEKATAVWQGKGAELLGVDGKSVKREDFIAFLEGKLKNPANGQIQDLADNQRGSQRRLGYDLTIAPPKSVSIVGLVGNDERVVASHLAANERAMQWLEKNASMVRVKNVNGDVLTKNAGNMLYATVLHETNRNNEPQIHSHNVIVSAVYDDQSKKWRSLTNDQIMILRQGADVVYKSELANGLQRAGYEIKYEKNGVDFEIAGLSKEQIETYSTRSAEIKQTLKDRGVDVETADFHQRQIATIDSRSKKNDQPRDVLQSIWNGLAESNNLDINGVVAQSRENAIQNNINAFIAYDKAKPLNSVSWAIAHLSEREQSFARTDIEIAALKFGQGRIDSIEKAIEREIKAGNLISRGTNEDGAAIFTTNKAVEKEKEFVQNIRDGIGKGNVIFNKEEEFKAALQSFESRKSQEVGTSFKLSGEQVKAARNILMQGDSYQAIQGDAGTGKTAALEMVREAAESKSWKVIGIATSATAAKDLEAGSGIKSQTIASFLGQRDNSIRLAKIELAGLKEGLLRNEASPYADRPRIEIHQLAVKAANGQQSVEKYTFDNQKGAVYKSPDNLRNRLGEFLLETSKDKTTSVAVSQGQSLSERFTERANTTKNKITENMAHKLITYEKVGTVETIAAKNALSLKLDGDRDGIKFKISTLEAQVANLEKTGTKEGTQLLFVMDEANMTGIDDALSVSRLVRDTNAIGVFQGDVKQLNSVPAGKMLEQAMEAGMNVSVLKETRRFDNATEQTKEAVVLMNQGRMAEAISKLDRFEVSDKELPAKTAERYLINLENLMSKGNKNPSVSVVTMTNNDRKSINKAVHDILSEKGHLKGDVFVKSHLDDPKLTEAQRLNVAALYSSGVDHLAFMKPYREIGVKQNEVVRVNSFDAKTNTITIVNSQGREVTMNPKQQDKFHAYKLETREYGVGDKVESRSIIHLDIKGARRVDNGERGVISAIDENGATIKWSDAKGKVRELNLSNDKMRMLDLGYAHTTYREEGATNSREIFAVGKTGAKVFHQAAGYVAGTRAKDNSELVTADFSTMLKNADKQVTKTTAIDVDKSENVSKGKSVSQEINNGNTKTQDKEKDLQRTQANQNLGFRLE